MIIAGKWSVTSAISGDVGRSFHYISSVERQTGLATMHLLTLLDPFASKLTVFGHMQVPC